MTVYYDVFILVYLTMALDKFIDKSFHEEPLCPSISSSMRTFILNIASSLPVQQESSKALEYYVQI